VPQKVKPISRDIGQIIFYSIPIKYLNVKFPL